MSCFFISLYIKKLLMCTVYQIKKDYFLGFRVFFFCSDAALQIFSYSEMILNLYSSFSVIWAPKSHKKNKSFNFVSKKVWTACILWLICCLTNFVTKECFYILKFFKITQIVLPWFGIKMLSIFNIPSDFIFLKTVI